MGALPLKAQQPRWAHQPHKLALGKEPREKPVSIGLQLQEKEFKYYLGVKIMNLYSEISP